MASYFLGAPVIASTGDRVIRLPAVREGYERLGAPEKDLLLVGRRRGASREYSHTDVLLGPSAAHDVHLAVAGWLEREG